MAAATPAIVLVATSAAVAISSVALQVSSFHKQGVDDMVNSSLNLSATGEELRRRFFELRTRQDVATLLDLDEARLKYHLYISSGYEKYTTFQLPKKSGGTRQISAPVTPLKIIQKKLNQVLQNVYKPRPSAHGFVLGKNIVSNANPHSGKRWVLNVDLKDFFPSINFGRVRGMFIKAFSLDPSVATILAQICCNNNQLPQGAPTSPIISNMICAKMDKELQDLAEKHRCFYTRYADDMTFSTNLRTFPQALAIFNIAKQLEVSSELYQIVKGNGFEINTRKVRLLASNQRQEVTGLTVNIVPNVRRKYVRQIRAMLHAWKKFGLQAAQEEHVRKNAQRVHGPQKQTPPFNLVVKGKIEFLGMVRGKKDNPYLRFLQQLKELDPTLVKEPQEVTHIPDDPYTKFETGLASLLEKLGQGNPRFEDALILEMRLKENIENCRMYGENSDYTSGRNRIIDQLNHLALRTLHTSFNRLCGI